MLHVAGESLLFTVLRKGRRATVEVVSSDRAEFYQ